MKVLYWTVESFDALHRTKATSSTTHQRIHVIILLYAHILAGAFRN